MFTPKLKKIWDIVSTVLVVLVVLCAVFLMGSRLIGYNVYTVLSGSMEPEYSVGDLLYVRQMSFEEVKKIPVNTPITFMLNEEGTIATHRIVDVDYEQQCFYTKGDTNDTIDPAVAFQNVIGVPDFSIPWLGYVANYVQHPPGMYVAIVLGILLIVAVFLPDFVGKKKAEADPAVAEVQAEAEAAAEENEKLKAEIEKLKAEMAQKAEQEPPQ